MSITFRALTPGEEEEAINIIEKGFQLEAMPHFRWKLMDNPLWKYEHSLIGESEGRIAAVAFFEPQSLKFFHRTIDVLTGGSGAVHKDFRKRGYYKKMAESAVDLTNRLGKPMLIGYATENWFTYYTLKKQGFYPLFSQKMCVKILNVKKTFVIAAERLNKMEIPKEISLDIRIVPDTEEPFVLAVREGTFFIKEDAHHCDLVISGDLQRVAALFIGGVQKKILPLLLKRTVRIRIRLSSLRKVVTLTKMVMSWK